MTIYLDSSVVARSLVGDGDPLQEWGRWERAYSSELMVVEVRRMLDRLRLERALDDPDLADAHHGLSMTLRVMSLIEVTPEVLRRASQPLPTAVKTLDAIHLASALLFAERTEASVLFGTHDRRQAIAARALGFDVVGVSTRWAETGPVQQVHQSM